MQVDWEVFDVPIDRMRERVADEFRKNKHVTNHKIIDKLRIKAGQVTSTFSFLLSVFHCAFPRVDCCS